MGPRARSAVDGVLEYSFAAAGQPSRLEGRQAIRDYFSAGLPSRSLRAQDGSTTTVHDTAIRKWSWRRSRHPRPGDVLPGERVTVAGDGLVAILQELFADPRIAEVHIRDVEAQCFIARVTR